MQDLLVLHAHQGEAGAQAVAAHGKAAAGAAPLVFPGREDQAGFHKGPQPVALPQGLTHGFDQVAVEAVFRKALVQPVELLLVLGGDSVDFRLQAFHLVGSPHAVLILHLQAKGLAGAGAAQQIVLFDENGDVVQHMGVELGAPQEHGLASGFLQGLHRQAELFHAQGVFVDAQAFFHALYTFGHGRIPSFPGNSLPPSNHKARLLARGWARFGSQAQNKGGKLGWVYNSCNLAGIVKYFLVR